MPPNSSPPLRRIIALTPLIKLLVLPLSYAFPSHPRHVNWIDTQKHKDPEADSNGWLYLVFAGILVLLGGAFAGLTIALMGQDEVYLQVLAASGEPTERKNASKVLGLLKRGKHWVLVTLLLSNVITNETLPIMLDRSLGGGWQAVLGSTVLIVIFGEIVPQSICVRYGLPIGAFMAPFVLGLMWLMAFIAWPTAKLLDYLLGEDHGTTYKKAGLKTLVTLHRTLGTSLDERLNKDEVTIISAVLDLKEKAVGSIMTPMEDVFTLSADTILDEDMMNTILSEGYSRIPIYMVNDPENFIGMLLVKMLITYDPEDCWRVEDFQLATLPETGPETSCLDIVNFFQEGKSHMVLVSASPGGASGALGVITLEDVIEELIGEEIIDESDVFVDVHKAIRRINPVSYFKIPKEQKEKNAAVASAAAELDGMNGRRVSGQSGIAGATSGMNETAQRQKLAKMMKRRFSGGYESMAFQREDPELRNHLRHLGPSNLASKPKTTKISSVKIKPGQILDHGHIIDKPTRRPSGSREVSTSSQREESAERDRKLETQAEAIESTGLLSAGYPASDAVHTVGYGTLSTSPAQKVQPFLDGLSSVPTLPSPLRHTQSASPATFGKENSWTVPVSTPPPPQGKENEELSTNNEAKEEASKPESTVQGIQPQSTSPTASKESSRRETISATNEPTPSMPTKLVVTLDPTPSHASSDEDDTQNPDEESSGNTGHSSYLSVGSSRNRAPGGPERVARSGKLRERDMDVGGVRKVVLDVHGESGDERGGKDAKESDALLGDDGEAGKKDKKKRKKKKNKKRGKGGGSASGQGDVEE